MVYNKHTAIILMCAVFLGYYNSAVAQDKSLQQPFPANCEVIEPAVVRLGLPLDGLHLTNQQYNEVREIVYNARLNVCRIYGAISQQEAQRIKASLNSSDDLINIFQYKINEQSSLSQQELSLVVKALKGIVTTLNGTQMNQIRQQLPDLKLMSEKHMEYVQFERIRSVYYSSLLSSKDLNLALFLQSMMSQGFKEKDHLYYPRSQVEMALFPLQITSQQQEKIIQLLKLNYLTEYKYYQKICGLEFKLIDTLLDQNSDEQSIRSIQSEIEYQYIGMVKQKMRSFMKKN